MKEIINDSKATDPAAQAVSALSGMGLSTTEARVYVYLLQHSPATGYKVAKGTGRSFSNAYQILESLGRLGAVLEDKGTRSLYRALPIDDLLAHLKRRLDDQGRQVVEAVKKLSLSESDQRLWEIRNIDHVYEVFRRMLGECRERALVELFPEPCEIVKKTLEREAARGVQIVARLYEPSRLEGVRTIVSPFGEKNLKAWGSQWLSLHVDGLQYLQANLMNGGRGVFHAIWSRNIYVARTLYSYLNSDFHHYSFREVLETVGSVEELRAAYRELEEVFPPGGDLGFGRLIQHTDGKAPGEDKK